MTLTTHPNPTSIPLPKEGQKMMKKLAVWMLMMLWLGGSANAAGAGEFVRLFPNLPPQQATEEQLIALAASMVDPNLDADNNPAGELSMLTYAGQFLDHDMTLDPTPLLEAGNEISANRRTAYVDLDSVYGGGPAVAPQLYNADGSFKLGVAVDGGPDLPREPGGKAILIEARNDENLIISQIHQAFLLYHNKLIRDGLSFEAARQRLTYLWQWIVVHELLPKFCGQDVVDSILSYNGAGKPKIHTEFFHLGKGKEAMLDEFRLAAWRVGHTYVRLAYDPNGQGVKVQVFNLAGNDWHGSRPLPANLRIVLSQFADVPGVPRPSTANIHRGVDELISRSLFVLPSPLVVEQGPPAVISLPERNLLRGKRLGLESYEDAARAMGITPLTLEELKLDSTAWSSAPLWYGILREAKVRTGGQRLGPTGARIAAEQILEMLWADKGSYVNRPQAWKPNEAGQFTLVDLFLLRD